MRPIDADELLKNWGQTFFAMGGDRLGANGEEIMFYLNGLIREIKNAPTTTLPQCENCELKAIQYSLGFQDGLLTGKEHLRKEIAYQEGYRQGIKDAYKENPPI